MSDSMLDSNEAVETTVDNTVETTVDNTVSQTEVEANKSSWLDNISDEYKTQSNIADFKDVNDLAKSYLNIQKMVGNSVRIPSADSSEEMKKEFYSKIKDLDGVVIKDSEDFYTKLGRPESAEKYNLVNEELNQVISQDPNISSEIEAFKSEAFELGLSDKQASELVNRRIAEYQTRQSELQASTEAQINEVKKMWGSDFDNRLKAAQQMANMYKEKYGSSMEQLIHSPVGNNPAFLNMLAELGSMYKESGHEGASKLSFGTSPSDAIMKINELRADPGFTKAYYDDSHPGHKQAVKKLNDLYSIANNE